MTRSAGSVSAALRSCGVRAKVISAPDSRACSRNRATKKRSLTTATALIVLLHIAEPVLVPLGQVRQRGEVLHAVDVDDTVQVVRLVLDDSSEELLRDDVELLAHPIVGLETHGGVARHHSAHVGNG